MNHTLSQGISFYNYIYNYTDHLGNNRLSYTLNQTLGNVVIYEQNHYYPFGLKHEKYGVTAKQYIGDEDTGYYTGNVGLTGRYRRNEYQYKYNGKEFQDELGLNWYNYGWRNYDPAIARWVTPDPLLNDLDSVFDDSQVDEDDEFEVYQALATKLQNGGGVFNPDNLNPYGYGYNNPVLFDDPDGRCPICILIVLLLASEPAMAPTGNPQDGKAFGEAKEAKGQHIVSGVAPVTRGTTATSTVLRATVKSETQKKVVDKVNQTTKKAETLNKNKETGKAFENKVGENLKKEGHTNVQDQVTIKPNGAKGNVRIDKVSTKDGKTVLTEAKSSQTAPLTKNQKEGFPTIEKNGGTIVGKGKPGYPGGTQIEPTKVEVVRP